MSVTNAFVINLDKDSDKYKLFQQNFDKPDVIIERFPAVNGKEYRKKKVDDLSFYSRKFSTNKAIGCFKSHLLCWQQVVDRKLPYAIIFEDDVIPDDKTHWNVQIQSTLNKMSDVNWDVILLGYHSEYITNKADQNPFLLFALEFFIIGKRAQHVKDDIISPVTFGGTHAYLISNNGARKLLHELKIIGKRPVDLAIASLHAQNKIQLFACVKRIINTYGASESNIIMWHMSDGIVSVYDYEINCYYFALFALLSLLLFIVTQHTHFLYLFFFILFLWVLVFF
jgi:GR25 family glycosyltransferase involved in LPS biosynthesis